VYLKGALGKEIEGGRENIEIFHTEREGGGTMVKGGGDNKGVKGVKGQKKKRKGEKNLFFSL